jgi:phage I-like protein
MKKEIITLAACSTDLGGAVPTEIQLTPAGLFKAKDGRPVGLSGWILTNENAQTVVQLANSQADAFVIDYEHQTLYAKQNGQPAYAAGWFSQLEYREGLGLFATQVEWTDSAALAIQNKEYRYISPVLSFEPKTGVITKIHMAALTNNPALDSMKDLCALAADYFQQPTEALSVDLDELLERLRYLFNLPTLATVEEVKAQMDKLRTIMDATPTETAAASSIITILEAKTMPESKTETVDLSTHVPVAAVHELQKELAALNTKINQNAVDDLVKVGLSDGRITPALSDWAKGLSHEALSAFLDKAIPIAALSGTQTGGNAPEGNGKKGEKSATEVASAATAYQTQQAALGYQIDDIAAINHVMNEWVQNV